MRVLLPLILALLPAAPAIAQSDCSGAATQLDANFCAKAGWEASDRELNRLWGIVKPAADARGQGQQLLDAQRAWLRFRDTTCEAERAQYEGGSIAPMIYWSCMDRLTLERNADFIGMMRN